MLLPFLKYKVNGHGVARLGISCIDGKRIVDIGFHPDKAVSVHDEGADHLELIWLFHRWLPKHGGQSAFVNLREFTLELTVTHDAPPDGKNH